MSEVTKTFKITDEEDLKNISATKREMDDILTRQQVLLKETQDELQSMQHDYNRKIKALWNAIAIKLIPNHMQVWYNQKGMFDFRYFAEHGEVFIVWTDDLAAAPADQLKGNAPATGTLN